MIECEIAGIVHEPERGRVDTELAPRVRRRRAHRRPDVQRRLGRTALPRRARIVLEAQDRYGLRHVIIWCAFAGGVLTVRDRQRLVASACLTPRRYALREGSWTCWRRISSTRRACCGGI